MNRTAREFTRLRALIEQRLPATARFLAGATSPDLDRLAAETGLTLPQEV